MRHTPGNSEKNEPPKLMIHMKRGALVVSHRNQWRVGAKAFDQTLL